MAFLPPEHITVKRRRDEDPVEALFIQQKKQRPSGFWKLIEDQTPQYASPLASSNSVQGTHTTLNAFHSPSVPAAEITLPGADLGGQNNINAELSEGTTTSVDPRTMVDKYQLLSELKQPRRSRQKTYDILRSPLKARKFHLIKNPLPLYSPNLVSKSITQQHRSGRRKDLAVFVERSETTCIAKKSDDVSQPSSGESRHINNGERKNVLPLEKPHKGPNATAVERKWRTETWTNRPKLNQLNRVPTRTAEDVNEPSNQWNYESFRLAEQLQEVALEEICASEEGAKGLIGGRNFKVKPKPPKPRQPHQSRMESLADERSGDSVVPDDNPVDDDGDYVLDTYVRSSSQPFGISEPAESYQDSLNSKDHGNIGILVIEDEDEEALWEAFAEDQESDPEWNSEEEDENAEDYYGNDYPDDEVSPDDELGKGAYNYRHAASDDEEFGWSEED